MYYSSFGILALVLHIIINYGYFTKEISETSKDAIKYRSFLIGVMIYYISDLLWGILYDYCPLPLVYADTIIYFAAMVLSVLLWSRFIIEYLNKKNRFSLFLNCAGWIIFLYVIISVIVNIFVPVIFKFESDGTYRPGYARYVTLGFQIIIFLAASIYTLTVAGSMEKGIRLRHITVGITGIVMTVFIILQIVYPMFPFYSIGCLIGICLMHSFVEEDKMEERYRELYAEHERIMKEKNA